MGKVRVASFSLSLDGFGAGPRQDLQNPLGVRGLELHAWFQKTEVFKNMHDQSGGTALSKRSYPLREAPRDSLNDSGYGG